MIVSLLQKNFFFTNPLGVVVTKWKWLPLGKEFGRKKHKGSTWVDNVLYIEIVLLVVVLYSFL